MTTSILTLGTGGSAVALGPTDRAGARLRLDRLARSLDEPATLEFHQYGQTLPPDYPSGTAVLLSIGGAPAFKGEVASVQAAPSPTGWTIGYSCRDLLAMGRQLVPVTNPDDGTGTWAFNLDTTDPDYVAAWSGQSVGGILKLLLDGHASQLAALGLASTAYLASDLTPLTLVPPQAVTFSGMSLMQAVASFLDQWAGTVACWCEYQSGTADWRLRFVDTSTLSAHTLTLGSDPIDWPAITRDASACFTSVVIRGRAEVEGAYLSAAAGTLVAHWTGAQQSSWAWAQYIQPQGGSDWGTVTSVGSTTATLTSASAVTAIAVNAWANQQAAIYLVNPTLTTLAQQENRRITANTAMSALHGSYTVTLDHALVNGGYTQYFITGNPPGGLSDVWRRYDIKSTAIAQGLVGRFPYPVNYSNNGVTYPTSTPLGFVVSSLATMPAQLELDLVNHQVRFVEPVVKLTSTQAQLNAGGGAVVAPDDVQVFVPYSRGVMTASCPSSGFGGTAYTVEGLQRTWYIDCPQWLNKADAGLYAQLAQMKWATVCNTVVTGQVKYNGLWTPALTLGISLNVAGAGFATGWEAIAAPVRSVTLNWTADGANIFETDLSLDNRRRQATGDNYYVHPAFAGGAAWEVQGGNFDLRQGQGAGGEPPAADLPGPPGDDDSAGPSAASPPPPPPRPSPGRPASPPPPPPPTRADVADLLDQDPATKAAYDMAFGEGDA